MSTPATNLRRKSRPYEFEVPGWIDEDSGEQVSVMLRPLGVKQQLRLGVGLQDLGKKLTTGDSMTLEEADKVAATLERLLAAALVEPKLYIGEEGAPGEDEWTLDDFGEHAFTLFTEITQRMRRGSHAENRTFRDESIGPDSSADMPAVSGSGDADAVSSTG